MMALELELQTDGTFEERRRRIYMRFALLDSRQQYPQICGDLVVFPNEEAARDCRDLWQRILDVGGYSITPCSLSREPHFHLVKQWPDE